MKKKLDTPQKVRTTLEELEVLAQLRGSVEWAILKRIMQRVIDNLKNYSFNMPYSLPPDQFKVVHREVTARASAYKDLVKIVERADKKREEMEKNGKPA